MKNLSCISHTRFIGIRTKSLLYKEDRFLLILINSNIENAWRRNLMNSILVDNWAMQRIVASIYDNEISKEYEKFLSAIVLWDKIYYAKNKYSFIWKNFLIKTKDSVEAINDSNEYFDKIANQLYAEKYSNYSKIVVQGAIRYMLLSNYYGCDYFPSEKRNEFLAENSPYKVMNRYNYIGVLDHEINDYFCEMFEKLGRHDFKIQRPVLVDFIVQNSKIGESYIDCALRIKQEKSVIQYRKYLSDIELAVQQKQWTLLSDMVTYSKKIVNNITKLDSKNIGTIDMTIAPIPKIEFSKSFTLKKSKIQLTFLDELGKFAFCGRNYM